MPVKKACGKKKPEIQKVAGDPLSTHFDRKVILSFKSLIQLARGFSERKPTVGYQAMGTMLSKRELAAESSSSDMTTSPTSAFYNSMSISAIMMRSLLYLTIS